MVRPLRLEYPHAFYHVTSRGNARKKIYFDDEDRNRFLEVLSGVVKRYKWLVHSYCLMPNHYHLLVETPEANLSLGMRQLNGVYTQAFNRRHRRVGHVLQGRFKAILVEKEEYLLELSRYVVLNPVKCRLVQNPEDWEWSSYRAMVGLTRKPEYLETDWLLDQFSSDEKKTRERFRQFVSEAKGLKSPLKKARGGWILGGEELLAEVDERLGKKDFKEVPKREVYATRPLLEKIFAEESRDEGISEAVNRWGYKIMEVGEHLGLHYSRVSRIASEKAKSKT